MRVSSVVFSGDEKVSEEKAQALAIHEVVGECVQEFVDQQWTYLLAVLGVGVGAVVIGLGLAGIGQVALGLGLAALGIVVGVGGRAYLRSREPDVTVTSVEKGYWTGHMIPDQDGTVVFDATETIEPREFRLDLLEDPDRAQTIEQQLESLQEFPVVMTDDLNVEETFLNTLSEVESAIEQSKSHEIRAPVLTDDDPAVETLAQISSMADAEPVAAGGVKMSQDDATQQVQRFDEFESMASEDQGESVLLNVSEQSRELATELSGLQETATELLNDHIQTAGDMFGLISYHFYCPNCMEDDIESRLEVLAKDGEWYCDTCRSTFTPGEGVARHQIRDEVVLDVWDQLWIEKDDERRKIYESIEDQKAELEEREFEQRREEIRTAEERIKDIRSKIRDLQTEAKAKEGIVKEIGQLMEKYNRLNEEKISQFRSDVTNAFEEIDEETEQVLEETDGIIQERIEEAEEEAEEKAETPREEDRTKDREEIAIIEMDDDQQGSGPNVTIQEMHENKPEPRGK